MKIFRILGITAVLLGLICWVTYATTSAHEHTERTAISHSGCLVLMEADECSMGLALHTALDQMLYSGIIGTTGIAVLLLVVGAHLVARFSPKKIMVSGRFRAPPKQRWRNSLYKLLDPFSRLLRTGVINSKEDLLA